MRMNRQRSDETTNVRPLAILKERAEEIAGFWQESRTEIENSEAQTRVSLINPLLDLLDWDTRNPKVVQVEYRTGSQTQSKSAVPDYVLLDDQRAIATIEAKKMKGISFGKRIIEQSEDNSSKVKANICIFTNGIRWVGWDRAARKKEVQEGALDWPAFTRLQCVLFHFRIDRLLTNGGSWREIEGMVKLSRGVLRQVAKGPTIPGRDRK